MEIWGGNQAVDDAIAVTGLDAWVVSQPYAGDASGGDVYFVSTCGHGRIARFVVADIAGHGGAVSAIAMQLRRLMRQQMNRLDQTRFVREVNRSFSSLAARGVFATALLASYYAPTEHLIICNAGHPHPLWYRSRQKAWQLLEHTTAVRAARALNLPLGLVRPTQYYQFAVRLDPGDLVLTFSDAVIEARNPQGEPLASEGVLDQVRHIDATYPERFCASLLEALDAYRGGPAEDDVTLVLLHHNAGNPPRQSIGQMVRVMGKMLGLIEIER
jgi:serine phosphatase RsbU (regulator of sigma subunit)